MNNNSALIWLKNGIIALGISGLYSIILVILRTPQLSHFFSDKSVFKSALVVHVNLSVLVWLLSITCCLWSFSIIKNKSNQLTELDSLLAYIGCTGMILMTLSPLYPESTPIMNNYIPMLENIVFIVGISLFGIVILILSINTIINIFIENDNHNNCNISNYGQRIMKIVKLTSAVMFICTWVCFLLSFINLDKLSDIVPLDIDFYYEMLFWSGGHLLQFIYTQIFMLILLILAENMRGGRVLYFSVYEMLFILNFILSLTIFIGHYRYNIEDGIFKEFFTLHMIYTGGVAPIIFISTLLLELAQDYKIIINNKTNLPKFIPITFIASIILFLSGGAIGAIISGVNVTIPAHYHGTIVGITIAFMGFCYIFCFYSNIQTNINYLGGVVNCLFSGLFPNKLQKNDRYRNVKNNDEYTDNTNPIKVHLDKKFASWQIITLTTGQIIHITGLALAGGYGVLRKTTNSDIALSAKIYMGMVGIGGMFAIIGGLIFVYICVKNLYSF